MGPVVDGFEARVVGDADNALPDGVPGELVLRADEPFAFATGYFGMPDKTVEAWRNLWFHTGDRVMRDADGYFRFIDRMRTRSVAAGKMSLPMRSSRAAVASGCCRGGGVSRAL